MSDFVEKIIDSIYTRLTVGAGGITLNSRIADINTEKADFDIDSVDLTNNILKGRRYVIDQFPSIVIWPNDSPGLETSTQSLDCEHTLTVWAVWQCDDPKKLQQGLWRYVRALTEQLFANWSLDTNVDKIEFLGHTYDSPWSADLESLGYVDAAGVKIQVYKEIDVQ